MNHFIINNKNIERRIYLAKKLWLAKARCRGSTIRLGDKRTKTHGWSTRARGGDKEKRRIGVQMQRAGRADMTGEASPGVCRASTRPQPAHTSPGSGERVAAGSGDCATPRMHLAKRGENMRFFQGPHRRPGAQRPPPDRRRQHKDCTS